MKNKRIIFCKYNERVNPIRYQLKGSEKIWVFWNFRTLAKSLENEIANSNGKLILDTTVLEENNEREYLILIDNLIKLRDFY